MKQLSGTLCCEYADLLEFAQQTGRTKAAATLLWNTVAGKFPPSLNKKRRPKLKAVNSGRLWNGSDQMTMRSDLQRDELHAGFAIDIASLLVAAEHLDPQSVNNYAAQQHAFFTEWIEHLKG